MSRGSRVGEAAQLVCLRCLGTGLAAVDRMFHVRWGERLLDRMTRRWEGEIDRLKIDLARIEEERRRLDRVVRALSLQAAAIYLADRGQAHDGLCFDPAVRREELLLDALIDLLVKERLAAVELQEIEAGHSVYCLEPDWSAIRAILSAAADDAEAQTADWLREGMRIVDEASAPAMAVAQATQEE